MRSLHLSLPPKKYIHLILLLAITLLTFSPLNTYPVKAAVAPPNDAWGNATPITVPFTETVDTTGANQEIGDPNLDVPQTCNGARLREGLTTIWYTYTPSTTGLVYVDTLGSTQPVIDPSTGSPFEYDTYIAVWTGTPNSNPTLVGCNDDNVDGFRSQLGFNAVAGTLYYIEVAQYNGTLNTTYTAPPYQGGTIKFHATTFADVPGTYWAWNYIEGLAKAGITGGCTSSPRTYCPGTTITRDQMAVFLLRAEHGSAYAPPAVGVSTGFADVPTNYWAAAWIKQLAAEGITGGCGSGNYCPTTAVTRDQMAVFLLRAKHGSAYAPPAVGVSTGFTDVATNYWAAAWIKQLAAEGITGGCGGGNYCPTATVSRDQMAVFLVRTASLPVFP